MKNTIVDICGLELKRDFNSYDELIKYYENVDKDIYLKNNVYLENHHIIPRGEGGTDEDGLVYLPYEIHIKAHYLRGIELEAKGDILGAWKNYKSTYYCVMRLGNLNLKNREEFEKNLKEIVLAKQKCVDLKKKYKEIWVTDGSQNSRILDIELDEYVSKGWKRGRTFNSPKGRKWITDGVDCEYLPEEEAINFIEENPTWKFGMAPTKKHVANATTGTKWMSKGDIKKCVKEDQVNNYLNNGWKLGFDCRPNLGKIGIVKFNEAKKIDLNELDNYLAEGWVLGQPRKKNRKEA